jgi:hypothetical protein
LKFLAELSAQGLSKSRIIKYADHLKIISEMMSGLSVIFLNQKHKEVHET